MKKTKYFASRRETPWDSTLRDNVQEFIRNEYLDDYYEKHPALSESNEANLLNAFVPVCCPNCGSLKFTRKGFTSNGIQRYCCKDCGKRFNILTGTLLDNHKISISEWIESASISSGMTASHQRRLITRTAQQLLRTGQRSFCCFLRTIWKS